MQNERILFSFYTAEVQPILSKDSANRMQCKMKEYFFSFYTAEVQPILLKDSANRMQCKMKEYFFHFTLLRCSLSYQKIVQTECSAKWKNTFFHFTLLRCRLSYLVESVFSSPFSIPNARRGCWKMPDARRVAPIRAQFPGITVLYMASNPLFSLSIW